MTNVYPNLYNEIVAQGEILSTNLFCLYLNEIGRPSTLVDALDYMITDNRGEPDFMAISTRLHAMKKNLTDKHIVVTQGFLCRDAEGQISNLGRGGSDYSAAILAMF